MVTLHRRAQQREKHGRDMKDISIAFTAGFWTCALLAAVVAVLWN